MRIIIVVLLCLIAFPSYIHAQIGKLFNTDNHLSSSFAMHVYQDYDGFIWVSTRNGLNRYDGYNFKVFKKGEYSCDGMKSNYINTVLQRRDKVLFVGNQRGVQTYYNDRFHNFNLIGLNGETIISFVSCFAELKDGTLLIGTSNNGIYKVTSNEEAHRYEALKEIKGVKKLYEDSSQRLWILSEKNGALSFKDGKKTKWIEEDGLGSVLIDICEDKAGNIYISTFDNGVWVKDVRSNKFELVPSTEGMHVSALYTCRNGNILLGLDGDGVAIMNPKTRQLTVNPYYSHEIDLRHVKVNAFVEDKAGNIWFSMLQKGVFMQPEKPVGFGYTGNKLGNKNQIGDCCVTSTMIDSKGNSWVGTDKDGLYVLDVSHNRIRHFDTPSTVLALVEDPRGGVWAGSYIKGLYYISPDLSSIEPVKLGNFNSVSIFGLVVDNKSNLWIATMGFGLIRYNTTTHDIEQFLSTEEAASDRKMNILANSYISQIDISSDYTKIFLATTMGLCCYDIKKKSWLSTFGENALLYGINIRSVFQSDVNTLWFGTDDGLYKRDMQTQTLTRLSDEDGLPDNGIASIMSDNDGQLWVATDHGLCQMNAKTCHVNNCFYVDDGLQSNEFSDGAIAMGPTGQILLGGVSGITWFYPKNIKMQTWEANVQITNLVVNGKDITSGDESGIYTITDKPVLQSDRFTLCYDDNTFSIQLSTLTYDSPEHITYSYSVNHDGWTTLLPGQNEINFSLMPPGTYKFRIKAIKNNQESKIKEFTIVVKSPWYRSSMAYVVYLAFIVACIYLYIKQRKQKEHDLMMLQEHKHAEELNEAKIRFFMNISHEIRTPMTLILAPLMTLLKEDKDPRRTGAYITIKRNAERILNLINQMMDLRKIEKGMMKMRMRETDFIGFVEDICHMFEYQSRAKSIKFSFVHEDQHLPVWIDLANFDKVVVNLLSNAFKYTATGGEIVVTVSHDNKNMVLSVRDNGEGIPKDKVEKIFERFYQSDTKTNDRHLGTGIGLDLANSLVLLHHGSITAKNNEKGGGATFTVTIPLGSAHLRDEEKVEISENDSNEDTMSKLLEESYENVVEPEPTEQQTILPRGKRQSIVVVEDDIEIQKYLVDELSPYFKVSAYGNGQEALVAILKDVPDLVISDVMMPVMDGTTLCTKLRNNINTNTVPVVLLTAKSRDEDKLEGLETGADAYLVKPFNIDILKRTVLNLINSRNIMRNKLSGNESQEDRVENLDIQTADSKLMERVMKVVNSNISNAELNVDFIAREVGLSRVHFYRKMKTLTNQSPHNFIRNIRMKQAARLFDAGHQNINDVMYAVGFSNTSSFSTAFKAVYGVSPRDYIKDKNGKEKGE